MNWSDFPREKVNCFICGADDAVLLSVRHTWPVVRCRICGFVYLRERPAEKSLADLYGRDYYEKSDVGYGGYVENFFRYRKIFQRLFNRRLKDIESLKTGKRILEVGCAYGFLLEHFRNAGWDVRGVEISPLSSAYARDELDLDVHTGSLESAGFRDGSFDVVLLLDVLEHLHRPFDTLSEIGRIMSPSGTLVVQCPYELYHWEEVLEALLRGRKTGTIEPDAVPAHLYFFQPRTIDTFLEKSGFTITGRQSGNYGEIRRRVFPVPINTGSPLERVFRLLYFRCGFQWLLYLIARTAGQGNGLIRYASFTGMSAGQ